MKRLLIISVMLITTNSIAATGWTKLSAKEAEVKQINEQIMKIKESFSSGLASSAYTGAIFSYLKNKGTPVAYEFLVNMCNTGQLPKHFIKMA